MFDSIVDQGTEPATGSQESAIENIEDPGRQRTTQEKIGRDLEIHVFFLWGGSGLGRMERHSLAVSLAKRKVSWLFLGPTEISGFHSNI